jgi:error-prone DNA polymerase
MYAEMHARSAFSFLEGASLPEDLARCAAELEIPAVAMLDRDNISGAVRFHKAAVKSGVKAIVGAEVTAQEGFRYPLIAETRTGYRNLCRLISKVKLDRRAGASKEDIAKYAEGLICLSGGVDLPLEDLTRMFGPRNVYAEVQRHLHRDQEARNQHVTEEARRLKIPPIATNGVNHATPEERELMDALTCVRHKTTIDRAGRLLARNAEHHMKSPREMARLFADLPDALANARELGDRVAYTLADLGYEFPRYPVPAGDSMIGFLRRRADEGARRRYRPYHGRARAQIEKELALIEKLDLAGYFLIVWDIVEFCRREGIMVQGRGSAANSAVCYALGITAVDPVGMELLFERFLSEERGEWPDIDLDLASGDQREKAIQYVYKRYGQLGAAMTANVITYCSRSAVRDIGKALGFDQATLGRIASLCARGGFEHEQVHRASIKLEDQFRHAGVDLAHTRVQKLLELSQAVLDLPRHLGQHSGGMVMCQGALDAIVPLQPATMPDRVVVQWDKEDCADMGIIKVDLLGLGMMAVLKDSIELIRDHYGETVDLAHLPPDDPAVYGALERADTIGMFQVESRAQMSCLPRMKPKHFYDIVVQVAIIRPGPIVGKMLHPYLRRRQGFEEAVCLHPLLEPVLKRTLGVPLFQEQLLRMAMIVADFTGGEAEELRRAIGFKRSQQRMGEIESRLRARMAAKGIVGETQDTIVQSITAFALYGFPESHAASFALISYASAYLKCHYLAAFTAAILNNQPMGFYSSMTLIKDAQRHGLRFLAVDATRSRWECTIEQDRGERCVRLGFNYVKGFREQTARALEEERARQAFASIDDLAQRVPISKDEMTALAELGALNFIAEQMHRRESLWHASLAMRRAPALLAGAAAPETPSPLAPMNEVERLAADFRNSGLTIGKHPMTYYRDALRERRVLAANQLAHLADGRTVRVAGAVICRQQPATAKGFVFLSIEDETGIANIILRPDLFRATRPTVIQEPYLLIDGTLQNQFGAVSVKASRVRALDANAVTMESHDFH